MSPSDTSTLAPLGGVHRGQHARRPSVKGSLGKAHFAISPTTVAALQSQPQPAPIFDAVPRNTSFDKLLPIMSRLPIGSSVQADIDPDVLEEAEAEEDTLDYVQGRQGPYTRSRLPVVDDASIALWKSLHGLRPVTSNYAAGYLQEAPHPLPPDADASQCPVFSQQGSDEAEAAIALIRRVFNWDALPALPEDLEAQWYGVVFRSARKPGSESTSFYEADRQAHEEAVASGGLLMYWYGAPDPATGENLATCIWTDRASAVKASKLPKHGVAARHSRSAYSTYDLTRYRVRKVAGELTLRIEQWTE